MSNMAQSKRHMYNRVSGPSQYGMALGGLLEQAWCLWTSLVWGLGRQAGSQLRYSHTGLLKSLQGPDSGRLDRLRHPPTQLGPNWDPTRLDLRLQLAVRLGIAEGSSLSLTGLWVRRPCCEALFRCPGLPLLSPM